ncbi:MAG TPA: murein L,D-transpeptidase catalytic domain family protein [Gemmatimonadales bacterium]|nr:murein L,D-transpeptidase catalytic domain family protein [Gemmatimonadales bacterium]
MTHYSKTRIVLGLLVAVLRPGVASASTLDHPADQAVRLPAPPAPPPDPLPPPEVIPGGISEEVWHHALSALKEAAVEGKSTRPVLTVIDYSRPATEKRLWVVDAIDHHLLATDYVAHGYGSGDAVEATRFSNRDDSHESSLGTFVTGEVFYGVRGRSLPLIGLEPGINDNAYQRGLLIHGTPTVSAARASKGTQGVTEGCAGVPSASAKRLIKLIGAGSVVFVWYPDPLLLAKSEFLDHQEVGERLAGTME